MKIICTLPNASESISGVVFKKRGPVMLSEEVSQEQADAFMAIPGYEILPDEKEANPAPVALEDVLPEALALPAPEPEPLPEPEPERFIEPLPEPKPFIEPEPLPLPLVDPEPKPMPLPDPRLSPHPKTQHGGKRKSL